jgi:hypothetical protein
MREMTAFEKDRKSNKIGQIGENQSVQNMLKNIRLKSK